MSRKNRGRPTYPWSVYDVPYLVEGLVLDANRHCEVVQAVDPDGLRRVADTYGIDLARRIRCDMDRLTSLTRDNMFMAREAGRGALLWIDTSLAEMVSDTWRDLPTWTPASVLPAVSGYMFWACPPCEVGVEHEGQTVTAPVVAAAWVVVEDRCMVQFLIPESHTSGQFSSPDARAPLFPVCAVDMPLADADVQDGFDKTAFVASEYMGHRIDVDLPVCVAALGATWLIMSQPLLASTDGVDLPEPKSRRKRREADNSGDPGIDRGVDMHTVTVSVHRLVPPPPPERDDEDDQDARTDRAKYERTHRWWVRGHWRQQAYGPKRSLRKPIFIAPHTAGAKDGQLRTGPVVQRWTC